MLGLSDPRTLVRWTTAAGGYHMLAAGLRSCVHTFGVHLWPYGHLGVSAIGMSGCMVEESGPILQPLLTGSPVYTMDEDPQFSGVANTVARDAGLRRGADRIAGSTPVWLKNRQPILRLLFDRKPLYTVGEDVQFRSDEIAAIHDARVRRGVLRSKTHAGGHHLMAEGLRSCVHNVGQNSQSGFCERLDPKQS